jgi:hypothetical protein
LNGVLQEQEAINTKLFAELCCARWIWNSRERGVGGGVPWNVQTMNVGPENYIWEKNKVNIVVLTSGLYEVWRGGGCCRAD